MLCKGLGWELDFITGGFGVYSTEEMVEIAKNVSQAMGKKVWFNYGVFGDSALEKFKPYVKGICSSIETVNPKVQKEVVPGKNIQAYIEMLKKAKGFKKSLAIVIGIGETRDDIPILHKLIEETRLDRLTIFALHPIAGTPFKKGPDPEYYAEWIAKTRIAFPKLEIIAGVPSNLLDKAGLALRAGANAITKFPAIKLFGTEKAEFVEKQIEATGRKFRGTLTKLPEIDWQAEIKKLNVPQELKKEVDWKLKQYLKRMKNQY